MTCDADVAWPLIGLSLSSVGLGVLIARTAPQHLRSFLLTLGVAWLVVIPLSLALRLSLCA